MASSEIHIPSTHVMDVLVLLISLILLIGGSSGANMAVAVTKPSPTAMEYWQKKFPETPMPPAILDLLTPLPTAAEGLKEVSVSYGSEGKEEPKKAFPMGRYMLDKEREMTSCIDKAGLKEVSMTYGSDGEEEPRKTFSQVGYMLDKERKKSSDVDEDGLKEVSVSYGSNGEEETSKTFAMGGFMADKECEMSLQGEKEGLKEVSVSYGPEDEDKKSKVFPAKNWSNNEYEKYLHKSEATEGLKEVSVSYGSEGKEEPRKAFPMGQYMLDKEREMTSHTDKDGLREVSVSYGSKGEVVTRKAFPMERYVLDKEPKRNLHRNKDELREVSVLYGSKGKLKNLFPTGYGHKKHKHANEADLKEVSVSYGSNDEEKPRKAFLRGGLFLGNEYEKSVHIDKEDLKEVSVSYGSNVKLSNLFPTGYAHQKYILTSGAGLKEVSVTYGSDGEEEPRKTFSKVGYMLDKECKKSSDVDEGGLKEVSVSYGSNGEEETSKTTPMGGYMVDMKNEKSLQAEKDGLKEVSVSYGSNGEEDTSKTFAMGGYMVDNEREMSLQGQKGMDHGRHVHAHGNKMQQLADVFFFRDALRPGSVITPTIPPTTSLPAFLPRHVADAIPFSADRFADVLAMFAPASLAMAREIRWALDTCGQRAAALLPGEKAGCATSLESLADLAASLLGTRDVRAFSAADLPTDAATTPARRGRYNVTSVRELSAMAGSGSSSSSEPAPAAVVACHDLTYPYAVFYCHSTKPTAAYAVTLVAATTGDGDGEGEAASPAKMEALAVCHLDTSRWRADNPFFVAHGVKPGEVSVCHFLTKLSIVWVPRHEQGGPRAAA
ncbi:BURP domain-containing protein 11 isoform X1 [Oryza sativa Japonica Group]|uniref:BURP domain-containing protein 11 isoform X1 n=1 Tax=Oryza sativa subsp. japonica TaxID=39947 RepID=UPI000E1B8D92|nr:BURP domain-containing protein 11 isoform X7 [Oryza sativa Japonica Group]